MSALATLAGAAGGLFAAALAQALGSLFWPLTGLALVRLAGVAGGLGALAAALAPAGGAAVSRRRWRTALGVAAVCAAGGTVGMTRSIASHVHPGVGVGPFSLPAAYLLLLVAPFAVAGAFAVLWCREGGERRAGWALAGAGAGWLLAALLGGATLPLGAPWLGARPVAFAETGDGAWAIDVDRRMREDVIVPGAGAVLAFPLRPGRDRGDVLVVGLRNGPVLAALLRQRAARFTVLEEDAALVRETLRRWPALERARAQGRLVVRGGAARWELAALRGRRFDLVVLGETWSAGAQLSRALAHRRDLGWTAEALRACLALLEPDGRLFVQRGGIGRVVATLREASGLAPAEFARSVVVLGRGRRLVSECWFSPAGFATPRERRQLRQYVGYTGAVVLYDPHDPPTWNFYYRLIAGRRVKGLYFSTPVDLSPALDERPFFDHAERLQLVRSVEALPEELDAGGGAAPLRFVPQADRALWGILLGGAGAACLALGWRHRRCAAVPRAGAAAVGGLWLGAATALALDALAAWSVLAAPVRAVAAAAPPLLVLAFGAAWIREPARGRGRGAAAAAAPLVLVLGAGAYRIVPALMRLGPWAATLVLLGAAALLGALLGGAARAGLARAGAAGPQGRGAFAAAALLAASLATLAASLAAPHFGYRLLWVLAAVAALAATRAGRPHPAAPPSGGAPGAAAP